jgi:hypothetical protein
VHGELSDLGAPLDERDEVGRRLPGFGIVVREPNRRRIPERHPNKTTAGQPMTDFPGDDSQSDWTFHPLILTSGMAE